MVRKALLALVVGSALIGPAIAAEKSAECLADENCKLFHVQNATAVVVEAVVVRRESSSEEVCEPMQLRYQANLVFSEGFTVEADDRCRYEVVFRTTSGCTGDKKANMTPTKLDEGENKVVLGGAGCGTLKAKTRKNFPSVFKDLTATFGAGVSGFLD